MSSVHHRPCKGRSRLRAAAINVPVTLLFGIALGGCLREHAAPQVAGWAITDPSQRHPIVVSEEPSTLSLKVPRGSYGLTPLQRSQLIRFSDRYRARDAGDSKLVIFAPSGGQNEVAAMQAVSEVRDILRESGFDEASITVEPYPAGHNAQPPVRISYLQFVAEAPDCGHWDSNLADDRLNVGVPNLGCASQANLAAMVSNPADLLGPRTMTPRSAERRDQVWEKYVKGDSTVSRKSSDERVQVQGAK
jgi:pilus assembly protein CpaD